MKKAAIISMTAFYLLLTTGMYICLLHCASEWLFAKPGMMQMSVANDCKYPSAMDCKGEKDQSCRKKHSSYVIKENLETGNELQFTDVFAIINPLFTHYFTTRIDLITAVCQAGYSAPPWQSGKSRTIRFRSIRI